MQQIDQVYIGGNWRPTQSSSLYSLINPATQDGIAQVNMASPQDVEDAVAAAHKAFASWSNTSAQTRADYMNAIADGMQARYQDLIEAHVLSMGCPAHLVGAYHLDCAIDAMRYYAKLAFNMEKETTREGVLLTQKAIGVCALINPWNYPLHQLIGKLAPALAAGCTLIEKPAEQTPLTDIIMAEIMHKVGLPAGVFNLIFGHGHEIGPLLAEHPKVNMVSFTGSTRAGIEVAKNAATSVKRVCQELGGKSAFIITQDADIEAAVRYGVEDVMANTGQTCNALTRMLIPKSQYQTVIKVAKQVALEQNVDDPRLAETSMGPLASAKQRQVVKDYIQLGLEEGASLLTGGAELPEHLDRGYYIKPTIFTQVTPKMRIAQEEIFGPVLCILTYDDIEEAIAIANDSQYGLSSAVYAKDPESALTIARRLEAGQCYIQGSYFSMHAPFGGVKQSGNGREWGEEALEEYIEIQAIIYPS
ncbi:aldehyde dehydrogenase [Marinomonas sp. S3726]|uniref:aldehyde dehydrogenase family protein n=1 Tax=Marinomonas sp. S3726 TaxID=579484 RepID=UPI0005FA20F3|nr:aldehyde dehydrogenase family protein [Marinomonas sp. S3726]KJZ08492.1 aldehyde dehydrogenase [Marinomonas sp. S3726]